MRNHLVLLIAKYCRLLSAANRLKCGKKVKGSIMGTLNKLRASLARLDKAILGKVTACKEPFVVAFLLACEDMGRTGGEPFTVSKIITTI